MLAVVITRFCAVCSGAGDFGLPARRRAAGS